MTERETLLERDRRDGETRKLLGGGARSVVRLSARMPASMRERGLSEEPVRRGAAAFENACRDLRLGLIARGSGGGALGPWRLWSSGSKPAELKRAALLIEEGSWLGQLLDIDVADAEGPFGRSALCMPPRPCVVCGGPAAVCAGRASHAAAAVEAAFAVMLGTLSGFGLPPGARSPGRVESGSPGGSAVGAYPSSTIREIAYQGGDTP
ncbi:MAG: hypothetical protein CVV47_11665 [Spirochaetae bacterium HGW-Spirochaetae-3]|jgi:holo-ACP synthase CitX|nr:MAG: hypothetical protein CVV47_11665 [Spirochaetae bacterium HGW-Spirochaetae-3]